MAGILLVWNENPEFISLYKFPTDHELANDLLASHGFYINGDDIDIKTHPIIKINQYLEDGEAKKYLIYTEKEKTKGEALGISDLNSIVAIVVCGFLL